MKILFLICISVALTGCSSAANKNLSAIPATPQVYLVKQEAIGPTPSASRVSTPTMNYQAAINEADLRLHLSLATATIAAVTAQAIEKTQSKLDEEKYKTETATAQSAQTAGAHQQATKEALATGTALAPILEREWIRTKWEPWIQFSFCGGIVLIALVICWAVLAVANARHAALIASLHNQNAKPVDNPLNIKLDRRDAYGWGSVDWSTLPISREVLKDVAQLVVDGYRYTEKQMTGSEKPLVKDASYDKFGEWMCVNSIAVQMNDGRYVIQHRDFFEQVLA